MELRCKKVKDIVLENSASASVFFRYGIDYCNGNMSLEDLSGKYITSGDTILFMAFRFAFRLYYKVSSQEYKGKRGLSSFYD